MNPGKAIQNKINGVKQNLQIQEAGQQRQEDLLERIFT